MKVSFLFALLAGSSKAFSPTVRPVRHSFALASADERPEINGVARFSCGIAAAAVIVWHPMEVSAMPNDLFNFPLATSTVHVADAAKELDMSLPSYDDIKSSKASVDNVKSLSVAPSKGGSAGVVASKRKKSTPASSSVIPSTEKQGSTQKAASASYAF